MLSKVWKEITYPWSLGMDKEFISSHIFLWMQLFIHAGIKVNPSS